MDNCCCDRISICTASRQSKAAECLDHVIVLNERHLYRILTDYFGYYHNSRHICRNWLCSDL